MNKEKLHKLVKARFWPRVHMSAILLCVSLAGAGFGKILLEIGVTSLPLRYATAVLLSYAVFLVMVRIWLWYLSPRRKADAGGGSRFVDGSLGDVSSIRLPDGPIPEADVFRGGGGAFGGGGASTSWTEGGSSSAANLPAASASGSSSSDSSDLPSIGDLGDVDDPRALILLLLLVAALAILGGVWIYLVVQAPVIVSEALFQLLMASGMYKKTKAMHEEGWMGSVWRTTWKPLCLVLLLSGAVGFAVQYVCPHAVKISAALKACD